MEDSGIDPDASRMQSGRSAIWARPPDFRTATEYCTQRRRSGILHTDRFSKCPNGHFSVSSRLYSDGYIFYDYILI